jgi:hypothetical protein
MMVEGVPATGEVVAAVLGGGGGVEGVPDDEPPPAVVQELESAVIFALVIGPTLPTGLIPFCVWNLMTAACVRVPK